jgi:GDPmannose 4,6-dehydratase
LQNKFLSTKSNHEYNRKDQGEMRALICGVGGQDGAYLSRFLLDKGYEVIGASRDAMASSFGNLKSLGIRDNVITASMAINDFRSVLQTMGKYQPDEITILPGRVLSGFPLSSLWKPWKALQSGR